MHRPRCSTLFIKVYFLHQTLGMFPECILGRQDLAMCAGVCGDQRVCHAQLVRSPVLGASISVFFCFVVGFFFSCISVPSVCNGVSHEVQCVRDSCTASASKPCSSSELGSPRKQWSSPRRGNRPRVTLATDAPPTRRHRELLRPSVGGELHIQTSDVGEGSHIPGTGVNGVL